MDGVDDGAPAPHPLPPRPGLLTRLGRWLLPPRCLLCGEPGAHGRDLCPACLAALPRQRCACPRCALPLPQPAAACGDCLRQPPPFDRSLAAYTYGFPLDRLLPRFKFHGDLAAGRELAAGLIEAAITADRPQTLIPVPLHPARLRERGYNQALELARPLAAALALPLRPNLLQRRRATDPQTELDAATRRRNVRGAFLAPGPVPGHIALVDDVMTTGATLAECARVLRHAGAERVDVWVVARAV